MSSTDTAHVEWLLGALQVTRELAVLRLTPDGRISGWHGAAERLFGYPSEAVAGQRYDFMFTEEDRARGVPQHEIELARQTGCSEDDRWHLRCDGSRFWASGLLGRHNDLSGQLLGYVKVVRDRTDLRMRMEALQSRVNTLVGELERRNAALMTLLHELRNPVGPLLSAAHLLQQEIPVDARRQMVDVVLRQTQVLKRLLEDAGTDTERVARPQRFRRLVLQEVLCAAVDGFRDEAQRRLVQLQLIPPAAPIHIDADPDCLQQMLLNLISNAIKYSKPRGRVSVSATVEGGMTLIRVEDDGVGIAPENVERIFELFTREPPDGEGETAPIGSGIGLAVVKRLASQHGGFVEARSPGRGMGSVFLLQLPLRHPPPWG